MELPPAARLGRDEGERMTPSRSKKSSTKKRTAKPKASGTSSRGGSSRSKTETNKTETSKAETNKADTNKADTSKTKASSSQTPPKKTAAKSAPKKAAARKAATKKASTKKAATKKTSTKKTAAPKKTHTVVNDTIPTPAEKPMTPAQKKRAEQERIDQIWKTFKKTGDENLRNILVEHHFPLVRYIAERLLQTLPKSIELDDLISAGTFGLMDAIRGFDLSRGIKFKTYCSTRIRGSILDELRSQDWVPRLVRLKAHKLEKAVRKLEATHGREANDYELARELDVSLEELDALRSEANAKTIFSLSDKLEDGSDERELEKVEILEDKRSADPVSTLQQHDVLDVITSSLTKKERLIIIMYYYEGLTMREIGDIMSLTESRVCQIHSNVMSRLKTQLQHLSREERSV
jgi:RNA polymerase sigma factor for flagellar operon FliA